KHAVETRAHAGNLSTAASMRALLPQFGHPHIDGALAGDPDDCEQLISAAPNAHRPDVLVALYRARIPVNGFRAALTEAWNHDHHYLLASISHKGLKEMFEY